MQTETDGVRGAEPSAAAVGALWRWSGRAIRVDGPNGIPVPDDPRGAERMRRRAAQSVHRLVGAIAGPGRAVAPETGPLLDRGFVLTDGQGVFTATQIDAGAGRPPLLMFLGTLPPAGRDLRVVRLLGEGAPGAPLSDNPRGVICFAAGTMIDTPTGPVPVELLGPGDRIATRDDGAQEILWTGFRHMTGARLYAMPQLRPVRIRQGALGGDRPTGDLLVSPQHRLLVRGGAARALFDCPEVLVAAEDLIDDRAILRDHACREVTYVHLMLARHQVVWANGVETESFHPAQTALGTVPEDQRAALFDAFPGVEADPLAYGASARRSLSAAEAAMLRHDGTPGH